MLKKAFRFLNSIKINKFFRALVIAVFTSVSLFFFVPLNYYISNKESLLYSVETIFIVIVHFVCFSIAAILILLLVTRKTLHKILSTVFFSLGALGIFQYIFSAMYDQTVPKIIIFDSFVWIAVILFGCLFAVLFRKFNLYDTLLSIVSFILAVLVTFNSYTLLKQENFSLDKIQNPDVKQDEKVNHSVRNRITYKNLFPVSTTDNIFYFCVDRLDERFAEEAYNKDKHIFDSLTGFTWYQDNISNYGHTFPAITKMLTGVDKRPAEKRSKYFKRAYSQENYLSELGKMGYQLNLYTSPYYVYNNGYIPSYFTTYPIAINYLCYDREGREKTSLNVLGNALSSCVPAYFRKYLKPDDLLMTNLYAKYYEERSADQKEIYEQIKGKNLEPTENKLFSFIHTDGCHYKHYGNYWHHPIITYGSYSSLVRTSFKIVNFYIEQLKEMGLYEDATIIITGDHGNAKYDVIALDEPKLTALFVKLPGESEGKLKLSDKQVSHDNIWPTILKSKGLTSKLDMAESITDIPDGNRTRKYTWDTYELFDEEMTEYVYEITGPGKDFDNWAMKSFKYYDKFLMD